MADKRTQRMQKKREKQKKTRTKRQVARKRMNAAAAGGLERAHEWPVDECYLSSNWHEQGAQVWAAFVRTHVSGTTAVALCQVDLAHRGLVSVQLGEVPSPEHVHGLLVEHSDPFPLLETAPELVVKVVQAAVEHGRTTGHTPPKEYGRLQRLWADIDPDESPMDVLVGEPPPAPEKKVGWLGKLFGGG